MIVYGGTAIQGVYRNGQACPVIYNGQQVWPDSQPLPAVQPKTMRFQFQNTSFDPSTQCYSSNSKVVFTWTKVADGIYDFHCDQSVWNYNNTPGSSTVFSYLRVTGVSSTSPFNQTSVVGDWLDIIDSNMTGVTSLYKWMQPMRQRIRNVVLHNTSDLTDAQLWGQSNGVNLVSLHVDDLSNVTTTESMLTGCKYLQTFTMNNTSLAHATTCTSMFSNCSKLESVTLTDTGSVTSMYQMFNACNSLKTVSISNTSSVTDMGYMFNGCKALTAIPSLDTSSVTRMVYMFQGCAALTTIPALNTGSATLMGHMFHGCTSLTTIPSLNTSSVTGMEYMFYGCTSLTTIPSLNTSSVTNMSFMFHSCTALTTAPSLNTSSVTNMSSMFYSCENLTTAPTLNTSAVTNMSSMFSYCTALTAIPLYATDSVTNVTSMFYDCRNVTGGALALYNQMSQQANPPSSHASAFQNAGSYTTTGAAELAQIPMDWGGRLLPAEVNIASTWTRVSSPQQYTMWSCTYSQSNIDFSTLQSLRLYSNGNVSQYNGINMNRSRIIKNGSLSTSGTALFFRPSFFQFVSGSSGTLSWLLTSLVDNGRLTSSQDAIDMPSTLTYDTYNEHLYKQGTFDSSKTIYFGFIVTDTYLITSSTLTDYGILYNSYYNANPYLYAPTAYISPQSAVKSAN